MFIVPILIDAGSLVLTLLVKAAAEALKKGLKG